jgi:hypothetical protein
LKDTIFLKRISKINWNNVDKNDKSSGYYALVEWGDNNDISDSSPKDYLQSIYRVIREIN